MRVLILSLLLLPTTAWAETTTVFISGIGPMSCGKVVAALEADPALGKYIQTTEDDKTFVSEAVMQYVEGFVTAVNFSRGPSKQIEADYATLELWTRNYCTAHPTSALAEAAEQFTRSHS